MNTQKSSLLITGCSSGIGYYVARHLNDQYQVIASARKSKDVDRLRSEGLQAIQLDLDDSNSIAQAVEHCLELTGGRLYALFNNGAYGLPGAVEDISRDALLAQLQTNLLGWHDLTRRVLPIMRRQGEGRIIQNSSVLGFAALPYRGAYNCSKFALEGLSDTLRLELQGSGIFVSLIEPGPIQSHFRYNAYQQFKRWIDIEKSVHQSAYQAMLDRLQKKGPAVPFTLSPEAVLKKVRHALQSRRPKPRYYVTVPTYVLGYSKRLLSTRWQDALLRFFYRQS